MSDPPDTPPRARGSAPGPFLVAHRAGNDLDRLQRAHRLGIPLVEADVRLYRGRLEVRHLKTVGPLPILWDKWRIANPLGRRLVLAELLAAVKPETELMLDLKGRRLELADLVLEALRPYDGVRRITLCSQAWRLLEPFEGLPGVRIVHSVGSLRQLRLLRRRFAGRRLAAVSIDRRLLDRDTVLDLKSRAEVVLSWPVHTVEHARQLAGWGVDGLISERLELAGELTGLSAA